jgi:hypothetical protein
MALVHYFAKLHDLLVNPAMAGLIALGSAGPEGRRWVTDRYVLLDVNACGVGPAVQGLGDGWYAVRRSAEPRPADDAWSPSPGNMAGLITQINRMLDAWAETTWAELTVTEWALFRSGKDEQASHARLLLDPDQEPSAVDSNLLARWSTHATLRLEQVKGEPRKVIRVSGQTSATTAGFKTETGWTQLGFIMPVSIPRIGQIPALAEVT